MENFQPPSQLNLGSGNVVEKWRKFKQQFGFYLVAIDKSTAPDNSKNAILLTIAGEEALNVYNTFVFADADKVDPAVGDDIKHTSVLQNIENYCTPRKNETYERYVFRSTIQSSLEPIDRFITELKTKVK